MISNLVRFLIIFKQIYFLLLKSQLMFGRQRQTNKASECYHSPFLNNPPQSQAVNLKTLIEDIKYLQTCFTSSQSKQIVSKSVSLDKRKSSQTAKINRPTSNSRDKSAKKKREYKQLTFTPKTDKQLKVVNPQKKQHKRNQLTQKCIQKDKKTIEKIQKTSQNFVLLQMEKLKLQKKNLFLQNQLLDQQLQIEKREKQLLKKNLNKLKIHFLRQKDIELPKITHKNQKKSRKHQINARLEKPSQLNIIIPQFTTGKDAFQLNNTSDKLQYSNSTAFQRISVKEVNMREEYTDSLLISKSESFTKQSFKENQGTLQSEFWNLLSQCDNKQSHRKWQIRQAMGDIANKLKTIRKL